MRCASEESRGPTATCVAQQSNSQPCPLDRSQRCLFRQQPAQLRELQPQTASRFPCSADAPPRGSRPCAALFKSCSHFDKTGRKGENKGGKHRPHSQGAKGESKSSQRRCRSPGGTWNQYRGSRGARKRAHVPDADKQRQYELRGIAREIDARLQSRGIELSVEKERALSAEDLSSFTHNELRYCIFRTTSRRCRQDQITVEEAREILNNQDLEESSTASDSSQERRKPAHSEISKLWVKRFEEQKQPKRPSGAQSSGQQSKPEESSQEGSFEEESYEPHEEEESAEPSEPAEPAEPSEPATDNLVLRESTCSVSKAEAEERIRSALEAASRASGARAVLVSRQDSSSCSSSSPARPGPSTRSEPEPPSPSPRRARSRAPTPRRPPSKPPPTPARARGSGSAQNEPEPTETAEESPEERKKRLKKRYRHYITGDSLSSSDVEREARYYEQCINRPVYKTTAGLERDRHGRFLSPSTGRDLCFGVDCETPEAAARREEEAWRLEIERNRQKKKQQKNKR